MTFQTLLQSLHRYGTPAGMSRIARAVLDRRIVAHSPLFDREWYVREHPDVAQAGTDPALHYLVIGHRAGLDPSPNFCGAEYAALHHLPADTNPLVHYERIGRRKGLPISFLATEKAVSQEEAVSRLREKMGRGEPLECLFLVASAAMFPARPLLDAMLRDGAFRPRIAVIPDLRWPDRDPIAPMERCEAELGEAYPGVLLPPVRPDAGGQWPDLLSPADFAVYPSPYNLSDFHYNPRWSRGRPFLGLYVNYGYPCTAFALSVLGLRNYAYFWKVFLETDDALRYYRQMSPIGGVNGVVAGAVKMDALAGFPANATGRKRVLIAPHHSVEGGLNESLALSNFLRYADYFAALPNRYPDLDFILRPHPFLFLVLAGAGFWGEERCRKWKDTWLAHPNALWSEGGDYMREFAASDAIVQDCSSFLMEYVFTGKPCCYMLKSPTDISRKFLSNGQECLEYSYLAYRAEDIDAFLQDVVARGRDAKAEGRAAFAKRLMLHHPHAADAALRLVRHSLSTT